MRLPVGKWVELVWISLKDCKNSKENHLKLCEALKLWLHVDSISMRLRGYLQLSSQKNQIDARLKIKTACVKTFQCRVEQIIALQLQLKKIFEKYHKTLDCCFNVLVLFFFNNSENKMSHWSWMQKVHVHFWIISYVSLTERRWEVRFKS